MLHGESLTTDVTINSSSYSEELEEFMNDINLHTLLNEGPFNPCFHSTKKNDNSICKPSEEYQKGNDDVKYNLLYLKAAFCGNIPVLTKLIDKHNISIDYTDMSGRNVVHYTSFADKLDVIKWILNKYSNLFDKIDINNRDIRGWTPLHIAVCYGYHEFVIFLLENKADLNILLSHNSSPCRESPTHSKVIHFSCMRGDIQLLDILLKYNAKIDDEDASSRTILHYAAARGHVDLVKKIISMMKIHTINKADDQKRTALHVACIKKNLDIVKELVLVGISPICRLDIWDLHPAHIALLHSAQNIFDYLLDTPCCEDKNNCNKNNILFPPEHGYLNLNNEEHLAYTTILEGLQESKTDLIARSIRRLGPSKCKEYYHQSIELHNEKNMYKYNSSKLKSKGGIYLYLIKKDIYNGILNTHDWTLILRELKEKKK